MFPKFISLQSTEKSDAAESVIYDRCETERREKEKNCLFFW
mgnify:CR=1 FL=1